MPKKFDKPNVGIAPELQFMSKETIDAVDRAEINTSIPTNAKPPEGYKLNPLYIETKSKRVQLVLQPSLYKRVKAAADKENLSFNEYCHRLLDEATKAN